MNYLARFAWLASACIFIYEFPFPPLARAQVIEHNRLTSACEIFTTRNGIIITMPETCVQFVISRIDPDTIAFKFMDIYGKSYAWVGLSPRMSNKNIDVTSSIKRYTFRVDQVIFDLQDGYRRHPTSGECTLSELGVRTYVKCASSPTNNTSLLVNGTAEF